VQSALLPPALNQDDRGIRRSDRRTPISFPEAGNAHYLEVEDRSFWFRQRSQCIVAVMRRLPPAGAVLDIGGGTGFIAKGLQDAGFPVVVVEADPQGAAAARGRGVEQVVCGTLQDLAYPDGTMPAAALFDVLEHIDDDLGTLTRLHRMLTTDGRIYLTVPAYQYLFSEEDRLVGHFRRYNLRSLAEILRRAGFHIEYDTYLFMPLPLPIFVTRTLPGWFGLGRGRNLRQSAGAHVGGGMARSALDAWLRWEARVVARGGALPFGSSCLVVARKAA
jgi:SAM-dependent methyltransferase